MQYLSSSPVLGLRLRKVAVKILHSCVRALRAAVYTLRDRGKLLLRVMRATVASVDDLPMALRALGRLLSPMVRCLHRKSGIHIHIIQKRLVLQQGNAV